MANRIKDTLSPELYEYYKNHRNKYERFASDLILLQAKLFKDMVDDKTFHAIKKRHGWEYECDCTTWLNGITLKINTFSDFRKLYKNRLKNFKFKSPEYYAECEKIVAENDVEFVRSAMRAQNMRNHVARNYSAPIQKKEEQRELSQPNSNTVCHSHSTKTNVMTYYKNTNIVKYKAFYNSWKVVEMQDYRNFHIYRFVQGDYVEDGVLPNNVIIDLCVKWLSEVTGTPCSFKDFEEKYDDRLKHYSCKQKEYFLECYSIVTKEKTINENLQEETIKNEDYIEYGVFGLSSVISFFVLGGIAYLLKYILCFIWSVIVMILWCICMSLYSLTGLFGYDFSVNDTLEPLDLMMEPITIWKVGGWIYGSIVFVVTIYCIYNMLKSLFTNKKKNKP